MTDTGPVGRGRGAGGGSPYTRWSKTAGGAEPGWQDALDGWWEPRCDLTPGPFPGREGESAWHQHAEWGWIAACAARRAGAGAWPPCGPPATQGDGDLVLWNHGAGVGGVSVGVRVGQGVGSGRNARQDYLAQPAQAGRRGDGGDSHDTQTMLTRRPGRSGQGYVNTRCPEGGARTVMPRRTPDDAARGRP